MKEKRTPWNKGKTTPLEVRMKQSLIKKGKTSPRKGVKLSKEQCLKISIRNKGHIPWNKGIPCREETKRKLSMVKMGYKAWNKGKILPNLEERTKSYKKNYRLRHSERVLLNAKKYAEKCGSIFNLSSEEYRYALREWSLAVKNKYNFKCVICGNKAEESHHIIHKKFYPQLSLNINNGISLCKLHHKQTHGKKLR